VPKTAENSSKNGLILANFGPIFGQKSLKFTKIGPNGLKIKFCRANVQILMPKAKELI